MLLRTFKKVDHVAPYFFGLIRPNIGRLTGCSIQACS